MRHLILVAAVLSITATPTFAAPCRDAKGKFIKCPPVKAAPARCKDAKGKFAKCGTPGTHSV